tara:strand:+ start:302 stop:640 length:339 start_codon:yes stop_codon:yes gene_type:complete
MSKNPSYKNVHNTEMTNTNDFLDLDYQYLILYNNTPHLIVTDENDLNEYMEDHINHIYNNIFINDFISNTYYNQPKILKTKLGYEIIEHNPFSITNYNNTIVSLTYKKVKSI